MLKFLKFKYQELTKEEKYFIFFSSFFVVLLTCLPLIWGVIISSPETVYSGKSVLAGSDRMVYFSQIEEARQNNFLLRNLYTSESQSNLVLSPLWWVIGFFSNIFDLSPLISFHIFRILFGLFFIYIVYLFISCIFKEIAWRKICFFILCLGSGWGVFISHPDAYSYINIFKWVPTDLWVSEGNTFLTLYHSPLFIASQIMILMFFWWLIERLEKSSWQEATFIGLMVLFLGIIHPYDYFIIFPIAYVWLSLRWLVRKEKIFFKKSLPKLILITLIASLAAFYFYWLKYSNPAFDSWLGQNVTWSPSILSFILGYGLIFIFYLLGIYKAFKSRNLYLYFLAVWSVVNWFLLFMPFQFQRRMANGFHISLTVIGVYGIYLLFRRLKILFEKYNLLKFYFLFIFIILLLPTNIFILLREVRIVNSRPYPIFIPKEQTLSYQWIKENLLSDDVVLSSIMTGNITPSFTGRLIYAGHDHQTGDWDIKAPLVDQFFFTNDNDYFKKQWLQSEKIDYILWTKYEERNGKFRPEEKDYLETVYKNEKVIISKVK